MASPFKFGKSITKPRTRLTDIETEEVSLVDKGANRRKFAVVKAETQQMATETNTAVDASKFLEGLTTGLTQLTTLTELVKAKVEKTEAITKEETVDWKSSMTAMMNWASGELGSIFATDIAVNETGMDAEIAAQTTAVTGTA